MFHLSFPVSKTPMETKQNRKYLWAAAWRERRGLVRGHRETGRPHSIRLRHGRRRGHRERGGPAVTAPG